jgi:hypothetical protein
MWHCCALRRPCKVIIFTLNHPLTQYFCNKIMSVFMCCSWLAKLGAVPKSVWSQLAILWNFCPEVLRQVWNLSDEDGDSMLSVREFCTAVYLLEKFTEGWPLPSRLPTGIHLDEPPTPVRKVFAPEVLGSGESSWRLPQGSMYRHDVLFECSHA